MKATIVTQAELDLPDLPPEDTEVLRVEAREALSEPFSVQVDFVTRGAAALSPELIAKQACVTLHRDGAERHFHGELASLRLRDAGPTGRRYRARLVPTLDRLALRRASRVFLEASFIDVATSVLREGSVSHEVHLERDYASRPMVIQHREDERAFLQRLLAAEGVWYRFTHARQRHTLVLADGPGGYVDDSTTPWPFHFDVGALEDEEHIFALEVAGSVTTDRVTLTDFDFAQPNARPKEEAGDPQAPLERYEFPRAERRAKDLLDSVTGERRRYRLSGTVLAATPGRVFEVREPPLRELEQKLLVVSARHVFEDGSYTQLIEAMSAAATFRPPARRRPCLPGVQTATVVGPPGEEIHVDRHGRVKVRFHWDRAETDPERRSAWIRLAQTWAGPGLGAAYVPRVGQEVVVRFFEGDPDSPVALAALYNGALPPPAALPGGNTQTLIRSASSPGGAGANVLSLDDAAGREAVALTAQHDLSERVEADAAATVGAKDDTTVSQDRTQRIAGNQSLAVRGDDSRAVEGRLALTVGGSRTVAIEGAADETVFLRDAVDLAGEQRVEVDGECTEQVGGLKATTVGGVLGLTVLGELSLEVKRARSVRVGAIEALQVSGDHGIEVKGASVVRVMGSSELDTRASATFASDGSAVEECGARVKLTIGKDAGLAGKQLRLNARAIELRCGSAKLKLDGAGIELQGADLLVEGSALTLKGVKLDEG